MGDKMNKIKKIIQGLKCCIGDYYHCDNCPYKDECMKPFEERGTPLAIDVISLLERIYMFEDEESK